MVRQTLFTDLSQVRREAATGQWDASGISQGGCEMQQLRFPIAVAATSLVLVLGLVAFGGLIAGNVFAGGQPWRGAWAGRHGFGPGMALPPELAQLRDVPADQRFEHFKGAQVRLTDRNGSPLTLEATPGVATAVSATRLTMTANDGQTRTFNLSEQTIVRGKQAPAQNDQVVVVTMSGNPAAHAVLVLSSDWQGPWGGHHGWRS
jgi:hypothetical protein